MTMQCNAGTEAWLCTLGMYGGRHHKTMRLAILVAVALPAQAYTGPFCLDTPDAGCVDRLSVDGSSWQESGHRSTCIMYRNFPEECTNRDRWPENDLTALEACCDCGGGMCEHCDASVSYRNAHGVCVEKRECVYYELAAETATTDRVCVDVPLGRYAVSPTELVPWSECPLNTFVAVWGTATTDVVCHRCPANTVSLVVMEPCSCLPGFQPITGTSAPCEACPSGTFKSALSLDQCMPCTSGCPAGDIIRECTKTHDVVCASQCVGPECDVCGYLARSEFARVMCADKTGDECEACVREHSNGRFHIVGQTPDDEPVNDTVSYSDFTVEPPAFETHPHRPNGIGRPIGIYSRKIIALAHSDDFTADLYWGNVHVATVDIGLTEKVQVLGPLLVWTAGSYDLGTNVYSVVEDSGAWQRILVSEQHIRYFEIAQETPTTTKIGWIEDGVPGSSVGGITTPTGHSGIFSHSQDTATFWHTHNDGTTFETNGYGFGSGSSSTHQIDFVVNDVRNGVANTLVATNDTHVIVLDMHDYTIMSSYSLATSVVVTPAAPSTVRGCVALGGTCSESLLCCDETHEYAKYTAPPEPTIADVAMLSNSNPPATTRLATVPLKFRGRSNASDPIDQPAAVAAKPVAYQSRPTPMGVKALGYNRPGGFEAFQVVPIVRCFRMGR